MSTHSLQDKKRFTADCNIPQRISERRIPYRVVTTPPSRTPATMEKNPNTFEAAAISGRENPIAM